MNSGFRIASLAAASALVVSLTPVTANAAATCDSRREVRTEVSQLVHRLHGTLDRAERAATKHALVEALDTFRGAKADTKAERQTLGKDVSALAKQLKDADSKVERKAIVLQIKALREQKEKGRLTRGERAELRAAVNRVKNAVVERTDTRREDRSVSAAVRELQLQYRCQG